MAPKKILVLGATGPSGVCLLRELLYRKHATIAYVRNSSKVPEDLASNPLLQVIEGTMEDTPSLSAVIARSSVIVSLLGPNKLRAPMPYPEYYSSIIKLMREHGVKRILAMSTASADQPEDTFDLVVFLLVLLVRIFVPSAYQCMRNIAKVFPREAQDLDWTVYRVGMIPGGHDEKSWKQDRETATGTGYIGDGNIKASTTRAGLARWLVDCVEGEQDKWIQKLPAIGNLKK